MSVKIKRLAKTLCGSFLLLLGCGLSGVHAQLPDENVRHGVWQVTNEREDYFIETIYDNGVLNGHWREFLNDTLVLEAFYKNGQLHGTWLAYYRGGALKTSGQYHLDREHGKWDFYSQDGVLLQSTHFVEGAKHGMEKKWYPDGSLHIEQTFLTDEAEGPYRTFFPNGQADTLGYFRDGQPHGNWTLHYANGQTLARLSFTKGKAHGKHLYYHNNGQLRQEETWEDSTLVALSDFTLPNGKSLPAGSFSAGQGTRLLYRNDGTRAAAMQYLNGLPEGTTQFFSDDGKKTVATYQYKSGEKEGSFATYLPSGSLSAQGTYRQGQLHGKMTSFLPNGRKASEGFYDMGLKDSLWAYFDLNGNPASIGFYDQGVPTGPWEYYYTGGEVAAEGFFAAGEKDSLWVFFHPEGAWMARGKYAVGREEGLWEFFDEQGNLTETVFYVNGIAHGPGTQHAMHNGQPYVSARFHWENGLEHGRRESYAPEGNLLEQGEFVQGEKVGEWKYFHANGQLMYTETYQDGKLWHLSPMVTLRGESRPQGTFFEGEGFRKLLGPNGELVSEGPYQQGKANGLWKAYHPSGALQAQGLMQQGEKQGSWEYFYPNGKIEVRGEYQAGQATGTWSFYNKKGKLIDRHIAQPAQKIPELSRQ
jgi:antitoxin component YwqK of YwqJK toxin-antitoxin module